MGKLFVTQLEGGNMTTVSEWQDTPQGAQGAKVSWHNTLKNLWNDAKTNTALVEIIDEDLNTLGKYREYVDKLSKYPEFDPETEYSKGEIVAYGAKDYEYINDEASTGNLPTDTDYWKEYVPAGKLFVMEVSNNNLVSKETSEWDPTRAGKKGAMVDYHTKSATLWNSPDVTTATVKILNENLNTFENNSEDISHE